MFFIFCQISLTWTPISILYDYHGWRGLITRSTRARWKFLGLTMKDYDFPFENDFIFLKYPPLTSTHLVQCFSNISIPLRRAVKIVISTFSSFPLDPRRLTKTIFLLVYLQVKVERWVSHLLICFNQHSKFSKCGSHLPHSFCIPNSMCTFFFFFSDIPKASATLFALLG